MTNEERKELETTLELIKKLLDFHQKMGLIKGKELEDYVDAALDKMKEIQDKLDKN